MARNKTGILELDEMLRGGFMGNDAVMIAGSAGTGKTTLGLEYLVNGASQFGEPGIYLTFEQLPDQIYRDAENFGWDLRRLEAEDKLRIVCTSPDLLLDSEGEEQLLGDTIKQLRPRRMVIDSLNHLEMFAAHGDLRKEAYRILMYLKTRGISPLVIWEAQQGVDTYAITQAGMSFLVDCMIVLKFVEINSSMKKALAIIKMRGSDHDKRLREYEITSHGLRVAAPFSGYEGIITGSPHRSFTQEVVGAWDTAFTRTRHKQ